MSSTFQFQTAREHKNTALSLKCTKLKSSQSNLCYLKNSESLGNVVLPEIPNPYVYALAVGLLYGTVFCTSTCLPYIASYIAGIGADFRKGVIATLIYNMGRVTAYALIGCFVGIFTGVFRFVVNESSFSVIQQYSSYIFGIVTIIIGISVLMKNRSTTHDCNPECNKNLGFKEKGGRFDLRAFFLGFSRGLIICPPLALLLLYSVPFTAPTDSFAVAVLFGLGTAFSPMLLLAGVTGWLLNKAPLFRKWISIIGGGILVVLGVAAISNTIFFPIM
jgi:cytochrome c-type biogenesis protein